MKKSTIPNAVFGLFAGKKPIKKGSTLGLYTGRCIKNKALDKYYTQTGLAPYAVCKSDKDSARCINASYSTDAAPHYANDIKNRRKTNMDIRDVGKKEKKYKL